MRISRARLKNKLTLVVLGRSGVGKGTQAEFILKRLRRRGVHHLETGRFLRKLLEKPNPTTILARQIMERGELFPSWFPAFTWLKELIEKGHGGKHLVFDGAPRRIWEAELVDDVMAWHRRSLSLCIYLELNEKEAIRRLLSRGRRDDTAAAIRNRLSFFSKNVLPVVRYYKDRGRLISIDGSPSPEVVFAEIDKQLVRRLGKKWPSAR